MFTHAQIWQAIDDLAQRHGYSASGLAKKAGLDPTTFNKSKRVSADGKPRWPSTESISKLLDVTGETMAQFLSTGEENLPVGTGITIQTHNDEVLVGALESANETQIEIRLADQSGDVRKIGRDEIAWLAHIIFEN